MLAAKLFASLALVAAAGGVLEGAAAGPAAAHPVAAPAAAPRQVDDQRLRLVLADRVRAGLAAEFAAQRTGFDLLVLERSADGRALSGAGVARFAGEGAAHARVSARLDPRNGRLSDVRYALLDDVAAR